MMPLSRDDVLTVIKLASVDLEMCVLPDAQLKLRWLIEALEVDSAVWDFHHAKTYSPEHVTRQ